MVDTHKFQLHLKMTNDFSEDIQGRINVFKELLDRCNMDHKTHQEEGLRWCLMNELNPTPPFNIRGGFIADEMGLGKTILMIGTFVGNMMTKTLIILPPVLLDQWAQQIRRITGHTPLLFHGKNKTKITIEHLQNSVIVLSTYAAISTTKTNKPNILYQVQWNRLIFDEGHHLRNNNSRLNGALLLKATIRWIVTGTPIQNKKKDFYNLCRALRIPYDCYSCSSIRDFILRRTKAQVGIMIPDVIHSTQIVLWKNIEERNLSEAIHYVLGMASSEKKNSISDILTNQNGAFLRALLRARQCCILPKVMNNMLQTLVDDGLLSTPELYKDAILSSSKMDSVVDTILSNKSNGCGKLVFCHFREEIDELQKRLVDAGIQKIACFDGRHNQAFRKNILAQDYEVLILQIQTGCEGLNLQDKYSEIYFVSPHWNPSVEDQAIARCHRIGQLKEVKVFRFQMDNFHTEREKNTFEKSIESYVYKVQLDKRSIAQSIISEE